MKNDIWTLNLCHVDARVLSTVNNDAVVCMVGRRHA